MRLLFDQNFSYRVLGYLKDVFSEAVHVKDFDLQSSTDLKIWNFAKENENNIVTFDADFYDLVALRGHPPKIIWLRVGNTSSRNLSEIFLTHHKLIQDFLQSPEFLGVSCLEINK